MRIRAPNGARAETRAAIRHASWLLAAGGALTLLNNFLPGGGPNLNRPVLSIIACAAIAVAVVIRPLPWDRIAHGATLSLALVAMALVASANRFGGVSPYSFGVFFVVVFAWIGMHHRPWTSLYMAAPATAAFVLPAPHDGITSVTVVVPVCILVAEIIAHAVLRLRSSERESRRHVMLLDAVASVTSLAGSGTPHDLFSSVARALLQIGFTSAAILRRERDEWVVVEIAGDAHTMLGNRVPLVAGVPGAVLRESGVVVIADYAALPDAVPAMVQAGIVSAVGAPLWVEDHIAGILAVGSRDVGAAAAEDIAAVEILAARLGRAMEGVAVAARERTARGAAERANAELHVNLERLERQKREYSLLAETAQLLQKCTTIPEAADVVSKQAHALFPQTSGRLAVVANRKLWSVSDWNDAPGTARFDPSECWALRVNRPHRSEAHGVRCAHLASGPEVYTCLPLLGQSEQLGVLTIGMCPEYQEGAEIAPAVLMLANHIALSLANIALHETLRSQADRDGLTGLFNRRYLQRALEKTLSSAKHHHAPVGIVLLDLDHFKALNDAHGHLAGDEVLRQLATMLGDYFRSDDVVVRFGGEEFLVLLPGMEIDATLERAHGFRARLAAHVFTLPDGTTMTSTASIGVASSPRNGDGATELIDAADRALYSAKERGRNRVEAADAVATPGPQPIR